MFCANCGSQVREGAKFCEFCGSPVPTSEAPVITQEPVVEDSQASAPVSNEPVVFVSPENNDSSGTYTQTANDTFNQSNNYSRTDDEPFRIPDMPGAKAKVNFTEAITLYFKNYANFNGRSVVSEYWFVILFNILASIAIGILTGILGDTLGGMVSSLFGLGTLIPGLAVTVRRLHDIGKSGWYMFVSLIPIVGIIICLIWSLKESDADNIYGPRHMD